MLSMENVMIGINNSADPNNLQHNTTLKSYHIISSKYLYNFYRYYCELVIPVESIIKPPISDVIEKLSFGYED